MHGNPVLILIVFVVLVVGLFMNGAIIRRYRGVAPQRKIVLRRSPTALPLPRHPAPGSVPPAPVSDAAARKSALARIDAVKLAYGEKLTDIAYVIENHALFDADYAETVDFEMQLAIAGDPTALSTPDLFRTASHLERAWHLATANAERLGVAALKDRADDGRRAVGLARKAQDTAGTPEGDALLVKLRSLLDVLGIMLPPQTRQVLESPIRPGIDN